MHLFEDKNFPDVRLGNGDMLNVTIVKQWMTPLMANYCAVFDMNCNKSGCGNFTQFYSILLKVTQFYSILLNFTQCYSMLLTFTQFMLIGYDDHCIPEEWCVDSNESPGFQCIHKSSVLLILLFHEILYLIFILDWENEFL